MYGRRGASARRLCRRTARRRYRLDQLMVRCVHRGLCMYGRRGASARRLCRRTARRRYRLDQLMVRCVHEVRYGWSYV